MCIKCTNIQNQDDNEAHYFKSNTLCVCLSEWVIYPYKLKLTLIESGLIEGWVSRCFFQVQVTLWCRAVLPLPAGGKGGFLRRYAPPSLLLSHHSTSHLTHSLLSCVAQWCGASATTRTTTVACSSGSCRTRAVHSVRQTGTCSASASERTRLPLNTLPSSVASLFISLRGHSSLQSTVFDAFLLFEYTWLPLTHLETSSCVVLELLLPPRYLFTVPVFLLCYNRVSSLFILIETVHTGISPSSLSCDEWWWQAVLNSTCKVSLFSVCSCYFAY